MVDLTWKGKGEDDTWSMSSSSSMRRIARVKRI